MDLSLVNKFKKTIIEDQILHSNTRLLIAVSGGVDSMSLLSLVNELEIEKKGIFAVYIDHCQREESKYEKNEVERFATGLGFHFLTSVISFKSKEKASETSMRERRYKCLKDIAQKNDVKVILTAHHLDDLIETYLMQILRSGSIIGFSGIKRSSHREGLEFYRPLLNFSKKELLGYARNGKVFFFEDETNLTDDTIRNRLRHHLLSQGIISEQEKSHLLSFFEDVNDLKKDVNSYYSYLLQKYKLSEGITSLKIFQENPSVSKSGLLKYLFIECQILNVNNRLISEAIILVANNNKPQGVIQISENQFFFKEYDRFGIKSTIFKESRNPPKFEFNHWYQIDKIELGVFTLDKWKNEKYQKCFKICLPVDNHSLKWRYRENGDILLTTGKVKKKLNRFLIEKKISMAERDHLLILASGSKILYLEKFGYSGLFNVNKTDKITSVVLLR